MPFRNAVCHGVMPVITDYSSPPNSLTHFPIPRSNIYNYFTVLAPNRLDIRERS